MANAISITWRRKYGATGVQIKEVGQATVTEGLTVVGDYPMHIRAISPSDDTAISSILHIQPNAGQPTTYWSTQSVATLISAINAPLA